MNLLFNYLLSESRINRIKRLHGNMKQNFKNAISVKSINLYKSGIQTIYDIVKAHNGGLKVETKMGEGTEFIIVLRIA